jgi:hypothetical protein
LLDTVAPGDDLRRQRTLTFFQDIKLIGPDIMEFLLAPARPSYFHALYPRARAQAEVRTHIALR